MIMEPVHCMNGIDMPEATATTIKVKEQIAIKACRCFACGKWECPEYDHEKYDAVIFGEISGLCKSCRSAIEWAKEKMKGQ